MKLCVITTTEKRVGGRFLRNAWWLFGEKAVGTLSIPQQNLPGRVQQEKKEKKRKEGYGSVKVLQGCMGLKAPLLSRELFVRETLRGETKPLI